MVSVEKQISPLRGPRKLWTASVEMTFFRAVIGSGKLVVVVREVVGIYADVVGFGVVEEAHGFDVVEAFKEGLADSVHAVYDTAVAGEDDGKGEVTFADEA